MLFLLKSPIFVFLLSSFGHHIVDAATSTVQCPTYNLHFQKIIGYRPRYKYLSIYDVSYSDIQFQYEYKTSMRCFESCRESAQCVGLVYKISTAECYGLFWNNHDSITDERSFDMVTDSDVIFYEKSCYKVPQNCAQKLWPITRIPGNVLVANDYYKLQNRLVTRTDCIQSCLFDAQQKCRSVKFVVSYKNNQNRFAFGSTTNREDIGECYLSSYNKNILPGSYRTGQNNEEYIENMCNEEVHEHKTSDCSFEVYNDNRFILTDLEYVRPAEQLSYNECQKMCLHEKRFYCQGCSLHQQYNQTSNRYYSVCSLHSEDILSLGPRSLISDPGTYYIRRVECLNITIHCHANNMQVKYTPLNEQLSGKIYLKPEMNDCAISNSFNSTTSITLRIGNEVDEKRCGILRGYRAEKYNEVMVFTHLRVRSSPVVEKQGDRLVKVGCIYYNLTNSLPDITSSNFSMGSSIGFHNQGPTPNTASSHYNESGNSPTIYLEILDLVTHKEVKDVQIGQALEFHILLKLDQLNNKDYRAVNLYTESDDGRRVEQLLDSYGCPVDLTIFPALQKRRIDNFQIYYAHFNAFQFPDSSMVKFKVTMKLCYKMCPDNCENSAKRRKRESNIMKIENNKTPAPIVFSHENHEFVPRTSAEYVSVVTDYPGKIGVTKRETMFEKQVAFDSSNLYRTVPSQVLGNYDDSANVNVSQISRNDFTDNRRILSERNEIPLQININVHKSDKTATDRLIHGENDQILIAGLVPDDDTFCINKSLLLSFLILIIIIQIVILSVCCYFIRKYKKYAQDEEDRNSLQQIHQNLDFDNYNRRVHWADQNYNSHFFYT